MRTTLPFELDEEGFIKNIKQLVSPNFKKRTKKIAVELLVIHSISMPPDKFGGDNIEKLFTNKLDFDEHKFYKTIRDIKVSAHFLIKRDGELIQFVSCHNIAWHAGESEWNGKKKCNDFSIGIELEGSDKVKFTDIQYEKLNELLQFLRDQYPIKDIVGHNDIAPNRKTDPGPYFKWNKIKDNL